MSNSYTWTPDPAVYQYAKNTAIMRNWQYWNTGIFNMWADFNARTLNPAWSDPWFEHEVGGIYNGPSINPYEPQYEMTQNIFYIYCWLRYKGYSTYAIAGIIASCTIESFCTGGVWEDGVTPYQTLTSFDPTVWARSAEPWCRNGTPITHSASAWDERYDPPQQRTLTQTGTFGAAAECTGLVMAETSEGKHYPVDPLQFDIRTQSRWIAGYGLVQWTYYDRLVKHAGQATSADGSPSGDGRYHWQLNPTLQLMVLEYERGQAMATPTSGQESSDYDGEWRNDKNHAYFYVHNTRSETYDSNSTWNDFATDGDWLEWCNDELDDMGITNESERDHARVGMAMNMWGSHYLQHLYDLTNETRYHWSSRFNFVLSAIRYWDANGGASPSWIPRARDIEYCELDAYHLSPIYIAYFTGRRRKRRNVRTVLL